MITILVLLSGFSYTLFAAITLETTQVEIRVMLHDKKAERNMSDPKNLQLPLCSIALEAKHPGKGYLSITHSPLIQGDDTIYYRVFSETAELFPGESIPYTANPYIPTIVHIANLDVLLSWPLQASSQSYSSDIVVHLALEI